MGLRILPYWLGTFCFDIIIYAFIVIFYFIVALCFKLDCVVDNFWQTLLIFVSFGFTNLIYSYLCGFIFRTVDRALKLFAIFNFFVIFCIPFMINTMLALAYYKTDGNAILKQVLYAFQIIFMIVSPFWNLYQGYSLINVDYKKIEHQSPKMGPLIL